MKRTISIIILLAMTLSLSPAQEITAEDILSRRDSNMGYTTAKVEIDMVITIGKRVVKKKMVSFSQGEENSFIEFLSPARDRGTKMLKLGNVLKIYFPSAERVMRLSGHMLRQSMMGSDFSYEDMTETAEELKENYTASIIGEEDYQGSPCYILQLESKLENKTYFYQKIWVDKVKFLGLKVELSAKSGKLLKLVTVDEIKSFKDRFYPTRITMEDKLRKDSKTEMIITSIDFDIEIPEGTFTERNLMRKTR
ncbi:outer membrane lipoprotein-sorting protein [Acidobacteriota bacterium]